eukprot:Platyproteum_vivax@DN5557_c0_g1_i2.p1
MYQLLVVVAMALLGGAFADQKFEYSKYLKEFKYEVTKKHWKDLVGVLAADNEKMQQFEGVLASKTLDQESQKIFTQVLLAAHGKVSSDAIVRVQSETSDSAQPDLHKKIFETSNFEVVVAVDAQETKDSSSPAKSTSKTEQKEQLLEVKNMKESWMDESFCTKLGDTATKMNEGSFEDWKAGPGKRTSKEDREGSNVELVASHKAWEALRELYVDLVNERWMMKNLKDPTTDEAESKKLKYETTPSYGSRKNRTLYFGHLNRVLANMKLAFTNKKSQEASQEASKAEACLVAFCKAIDSASSWNVIQKLFGAGLPADIPICGSVYEQVLKETTPAPKGSKNK